MTTTADIEKEFLDKRITLDHSVRHINILGKEHAIDCYAIDENDTTYQKLIAALDERGCNYRLIIPGTVHTMEYLVNRVNIEIGRKGRIKRFYPG